MSDKTLADVAHVIMGQSPDGTTYNKQGIGVPLLNGPAEFGVITPTAVQWTTEPSKFAEAGDILFCVRGNTLGRQNIADREYAIGRGLAAIRGRRDKADTEYIGLWLRYKANSLLAAGNGSTFPSVSGEFLYALSFPEVNAEEQSQIAAHLKAQLAEVENARQAAEAQLRDATLLQTRHSENAISLLNVTPRVPLGELLHGIEAGKSFQTTELKAGVNELGVLKVSAVSWNEFRPDEAKSIEGAYQPDERHRVKKGDLIISRANTLELVGAVVRTDQDYPYRLLSDKTLRLLVDESKVLPDYLLCILKWPEARTHIENNATGTSDSMRNISQKTITSIPIPMVSLDRQLEIVAQTQLVNVELNRIQEAVKQQQRDLKLLPQKILAQAFEI